jgi:hypothetical protein
MADKIDGCVKPSKGPIVTQSEGSTVSPETKKEVSMVQARVGKPAPDFELSSQS